MGLSIERTAHENLNLHVALESLAAAGLPTTIMMVDGQLVMPSAPVPTAWREVRLKTPAGMITVSRGAASVLVTVFDTASAELQAVQRQIADALAAQ